jgi:hypothetical protein
VKTKTRGRVEIVQDENDKLTMRDDFFQLDELVDPYRITHFNDLEENSIFCITNNIFIGIDTDDVLNSSGHIQVDKDDDNEKINI